MDKPVRIVDEELLAYVRTLPCMACASVDPRGARDNLTGNRNHAHHVVSRGAGGHDTVSNVMPLCATHHDQWHRVGKLQMAKEFAVVREWLSLCGHLDD